MRYIIRCIKQTPFSGDIDYPQTSQGYEAIWGGNDCYFESINGAHKQANACRQYNPSIQYEVEEKG